MMTKNELEFTADCLDDTDRFGAALAESLTGGVTIALCGTLGAGKTRLVQAIAAACGIAREDVVSPTFVLCQEYVGDRRIVHLDAYRIADDDEFLQLGVDEYFDSDAVVIIEWAERVADCLPPERLQVDIAVAGETARTFAVRVVGESHAHITSNLAKSLGQV